MSHKVLLVDDSKEIFQMVNQALHSPILNLVWAESVEQAEEKLEKESFNLILLDIGLPDGNGLELCTKLIAEKPNQPIFLLTANDDLSDKVLGFSAGADDYITKPFNTLELKARVEAKLKKLDSLQIQSEVLEWEKIHIDRTKQEVKVKSGDSFVSVDLTSLEFKLLSFLAKSPGVVLARDLILDEIWGKDVHIYARSVDTHISKLRRKLEDASDLIESIHGTGYKFNPDRIG